MGACLIGGLPLTLFPLASTTGAVRPATVAGFVIVAAVALAALRWLVWLAAAPPPAAAVRNVLIVGSGPRALRLYRELHQHIGGAVHVYGFVDTPDQAPAEEIGRRMLGDLDELEDILVRHVIDDVLITLPIKSRYVEIQDTIGLCERLGIRAAYLADVFQSSLARPTFESTGRFQVVRMHVVTDDQRLLVKRTIDLIGCGVGLLFAAPFMLLVAAAIKLTSPGPIIFKQERFGLNKRRFSMYKFRTMIAGAERLQAELEGRNEASGPVFKIRDDPRVTSLGRFLRRTSLDELPQLFNVMRGRHVARRPAAAARSRCTSVFGVVAHAALQRAAGNHGTLAGHGSKRSRVRPLGGARSRVHRWVVNRPGLEDSRDDVARRHPRSGRGVAGGRHFDRDARTPGVVAQR